MGAAVAPGADEADTTYHGEVNIKEKLRQFKKTMEETGSVDVWWKRVWVIQEYHFSTEPPTVYIGPHSIEWV